MKIDDDGDDDYLSVSMISTRMKTNINLDSISHCLILCNDDYLTSTYVGNDIEKKDNLIEENSDNDGDDDDDDDDDDDGHSVLLDMKENEVILETPIFSDDDDDADEDLYLTPPLISILVHTPDVSDEE
jgi:hypothetical protein